MFFIAYTFKGMSACVCRKSENCTSLALQDKCNIELFLSPVVGSFSVYDCMIQQWQNNTFSERLNAVLSQGGIFSLPHMSTSVKKTKKQC